MTKPNDGGPALPNFNSDGMTLRDYFAAKAMQAIITKLPVIDQTGEFGKPVEDKVAYNNDIADSAYQIADAMISEREKGVK